MSDDWHRREVLRMLAAGAAAGGLAGCERRLDMLTPDVVAPPGIVPGVPEEYSSASVMAGYAAGLMVRHRDGRPVKVEGNPNHPASLGATDVFAQAMLFSFYDPGRARGVLRQGQPASWGHFQAAVAAGGKRLRILSGTSTSAALAGQIAALGEDYRDLRWHRWEAVSRDVVRDGVRMAYGTAGEIVPDLSAVDCLLAIDSDVLSSAPGHLRHARDFAARRNPTRAARRSRLYAVEATPTLTGAAADRRFPAGPSETDAVLRGLAAALLRGEAPPEGTPPWLAGVIADLRAHRPHSLVHIGPDHPAEAHALVHAVNEALGGRNVTFRLLPSIEAEPVRQRDSIAELAADMRAGKVDTLVILDGDPVVTAPADLNFAEAMGHVPLSIGLSSAAALWTIPAAHPFEAWSDARAFDGTATIIQPQALALRGGRSAHEVLALFAGEARPDGQALVREHWRARLDDRAWRDALRDGVVAGTAERPLDAALRPAAIRPLPERPAAPLTVLFRPEPHLWDGRFAANGWLQELPRPFSKLTWDNPLLIAPAAAAAMGLANGDRVRLGAVETAVWIQPGQAEDCVIAQYGGSVDYYPLRRAGTLSSAPATLQRIGGQYPLAATEHHAPLPGQGEDLLRGGQPGPSLYDPPERAETAWGMSIDLNACIGCNACVIACQAENNIPVVGKEQVLRQREMHWLRIDRYYGESEEQGFVDWLPILCMHCEEAPCEVVCPVGATVHDAEGLNVMVYNRCVGTRFCSNNCPYKVRRFNYLAFSAEEKRPSDSRNPDVTVRARGVMEKCTFCLQRIAAARVQADIENRPVRDGEVVTACQAACPSRAITFGDIHDPASAVAARKKSPLSVALLGELNTRPRVTYERRVRDRGEPA